MSGFEPKSKKGAKAYANIHINHYLVINRVAMYSVLYLLLVVYSIASSKLVVKIPWESSHEGRSVAYISSIFYKIDTISSNYMKMK